MDQVTKVHQHLKREEWKTIISECRASGMSVKAWCKANGIVEQTYYRNLVNAHSAFTILIALLFIRITYRPNS